MELSFWTKNKVMKIDTRNGEDHSNALSAGAREEINNAASRCRCVNYLNPIITAPLLTESSVFVKVYLQGIVWRRSRNNGTTERVNC